MFDWIVSMISKGGYLAILFLMLLENIFPPIPSELIMPLGGFLTDQGKLSFWPVVLAGTIGSFAGQVLLYYVGLKVGKERLTRWATEHGHWVAVSPEEIERTENWFKRRRGGMAVMVGRLIPGIRSLISIPAGLVKMPLATFLPCTLVGTAAWTTALTYFGGLVGQNYDKVEKFLDPVTYGVMALLIGSYLWRVVKSFRKGDHGGGGGRVGETQSRLAGGRR